MNYISKLKDTSQTPILLILLFCCGCNPSSQSNELTEVSHDFKESDLTVIQSDSIQWMKLRDKEKIDDYFSIDSELFCGEVNNNHYPLEGIDLETFEVLAGTKYARDKNHLYYPLQMICVCGEKNSNCHYTEYLVKNGNPATFIYLGDDYARDDKAIYFRGRSILDADLATFQLDSFYLAHDKNKQYEFGRAFKTLP